MNRWVAKAPLFVALLSAAAAAQADWYWGQYKTPSKLVVETDKFYVITKESVLNPQGCAVPGSGVVVRQALVGNDAYKQLYALFLMASVAQRQVEFNVSADCSFGPNVVGAALSTP